MDLARTRASTCTGRTGVRARIFRGRVWVLMDTSAKTSTSAWKGNPGVPTGVSTRWGGCSARAQPEWNWDTIGRHVVVMS